MKHLNFKLLLLSICLISIISCKSNKYNYRVKDYILTLEPRENNSDVNATIEITYMVDGSGGKSDGFKFVGESIVDSLICWDETGIIRGSVEYLRETKVSWYFTPVSAGEKKIKAKFILRKYIEKKDSLKSVIYAPWAGVFRVPVDRARFEIILHKTYNRLKFKEPANWEHEVREGLDCFYHVQSPLNEEIIKVQLEN